MQRSVGSHATVHELSCIGPWLLMQPSMGSHASFHGSSCSGPWLLMHRSMAPHASVHGSSCNRPWALMQPSMAAHGSRAEPKNSQLVSPTSVLAPQVPLLLFLRKTLKSGEAKKKKASHQWRSRGLGATRAAFFLGPPRKKVAPGSGAPAREVPKKTPFCSTTKAASPL